MLNLIIDIGNTRCKVAIFNHGELMINLALDAITPDNIRMLKQEYHALSKAIVSTTKEYPTVLMEVLQEELDYVLFFDQNTPLPIENLYTTPETLGKDRLAAAIGANKFFPNTNVLVIDAGTAITYEFVNANNQYEGGFISPGLSMRFKALNTFTHKLPLLDAGNPELPKGDSTISSIKGGVQYGLEGEIERIITYFNKEACELKIILTGGDKNYFEKLIKKYKFVALESTLFGLNTLLEFNYLRTI